MKHLLPKFLLLFLATLFTPFCFSQETEKKETPVFIAGKVNLTTKGISNIPNMSLGKPALMLDFSAGKGRWSFDPQFHFDIDTYKPWVFTIWGRYQIIQDKKFRMNVGLHPAFTFDKIQITENGESKSILRSNRYLAGEYSATYNITNNISIGPYYVYTHALEKDLIRDTHYIALMAGFHNISLYKDYYINIDPQLYYVRMDSDGGFFAAAGLTLAKKKFPFQLSVFANQKLKKNNPVIGDDFMWSLSLSYSFYQQLFTKK